MPPGHSGAKEAPSLNDPRSELTTPPGPGLGPDLGAFAEGPLTLDGLAWTPPWPCQHFCIFALFPLTVSRQDRHRFGIRSSS